MPAGSRRRKLSGSTSQSATDTGEAQGETAIPTERARPALLGDRPGRGRLKDVDRYGRRQLLEGAAEIADWNLFVDFRPPRGRILSFGSPDRDHPDLLTLDEVLDAARQAGFAEGAIEVVLARTRDDDER
jgi:hypothetical protein